MSTFCIMCGKPLLPSTRFCPACGAWTAGSSSISAPVPSAAPGRTAVNRGDSGIFCPSCGVQAISDSAPFCTQCGSPLRASAYSTITEQRPSVQVNVINAPHTGVKASPEFRGSYGLPIPSMIIGIVFALGIFDNSRWDSDTINGAAAFCILGLVLGIVSVCRQQKGRGMAVAGIVLSSIGLLSVVGRLP